MNDSQFQNNDTTNGINASDYNVAVLIPAYNVENYIERTVKSCLSQDYNNLKIIVIDDHSTDKTVEILQFMTKEHDNMSFYVNPNKGKTTALRYAIDLLKDSGTDYITILDADDYLSDSTIISDCVDAAIRYQVGCVQFNYRRDTGRNILCTPTQPYFIQGTQMIIKEILKCHYIDGNLQCCLYPYDAIYKGFHPQKCNNEDYLNKIPILIKAGKTVVIPRIGYIYQTSSGNNSLSTKGITYKNWIPYLHARKFCGWLNRSYPELKDVSQYFLDDFLYWVIRRMAETKDYRSLCFYYEAKSDFKHRYFRMMKCRYFGLQSKVSITILWISFDLYHIMRMGVKIIKSQSTL